MKKTIWLTLLLLLALMLPITAQATPRYSQARPSLSFSGTTIQCKQTGGQQIGQLSVDWYYLVNTDGVELTGNADAQAPECKAELNMGGETTLTLDWTEPYGQLPSGNYRLTLNIIDLFDPEQVHPLMQDFHDWQVYDIEFSIP